MRVHVWTRTYLSHLWRVFRSSLLELSLLYPGVLQQERFPSQLALTSFYNFLFVKPKILFWYIKSNAPSRHVYINDAQALGTSPFTDGGLVTGGNIPPPHPRNINVTPPPPRTIIIIRWFFGKSLKTHLLGQDWARQGLNLLWRPHQFSGQQAQWILLKILFSNMGPMAAEYNSQINDVSLF